MLNRLLFITAVILVVAGCASDDAEVSGDAAVEFQLDYEKYTLDNGLEIILHVDNSDPVVAVSSVYHVGSSREVPGRTGFAHFFEHMTFNDSENVPRGANRKYIPELGGTRNGGTSFDYTIYYEVVPKDALEKIFWIDSDRMGYMINTVTDSALAREKEVVKNEKRQRVDNQPYGHTGAVMLSNLFPEGHPYSWSVIGSLEDLQNATLEDVTEFYEKWYGANNVTLAVVGDFDPEVIKPQLEQWFGEIRRGPEVDTPEPQPVTLEETINLWYPDNFARLPELTRIWPTVENYHEDTYALSVLASYLSDSKRSPLYLEIVEQQQLAPAVDVSSENMEMAGWISVSARGKAGTQLDDIANALESALAQFAEEGIPAEELQRIKAEQETGYYSQLSSVLGKANLLASLNEFVGDPGYASEYIRRVQAVTAEDVLRVFNQYVVGQHFIQTSFVPREAPELAVSGATLAEVTEEQIVQGAEAEVSQGEEAEYEMTPSKYDRSEPPLGELPLLTAPDIWTGNLANGIDVIGIEDNEIPLVALNLLLPGGSWLDTPDRTGTASLLAELSMQGTADRTPAELETAIGMLGASIEFSASDDMFGINVVTLERNLEDTLALVEEMLLEPRWDQAEFDRLKSAALTNITAARASAGAISANIWFASVYGEQHPYGRQSGGTEESIGAMTIDDLKAWHANYLAPSGGKLQVVGAVDKERVMDAFSGLADRWAGEPAASLDYKLADAPAGQAVYFVDMPDAKQSVVRVGKRTAQAGEDGWIKLNFANQEIGGGSSGRLTQLLRIEKGYTYGAYSQLGEYASDVSPWLASTSVRSNVTLESMQLIREQIADYAETFSDEDAAVSKNLILKRNARAFETGDAKLSLLNRIALHGLPYDIVEHESDILQGMSAEDFRDTINEYLNESEMVWVVVGDGATQRDRLAEFGYGVPIEMDVDGKEIEE
ncbi:MAG: M16 family metallopeptidase [Woeseiaceae bacterium]